MQISLLDAGGAGLAYAFLIILVVVLGGVVFLEACVITIFKYARFRRALRDSFLINLITLIVGFLMGTSTDIVNFLKENKSLELLYYFLATIIFEIPLLYFFNRNTKTFKSTLIVGLTMNVVSYLLLAILFYM